MLFVGILTLSCEDETVNTKKIVDNNTYIEVTTDLPIGAVLYGMDININSSDNARRHLFWIDLNNDGIQDKTYEKSLSFNDYPGAITISSQTFRIYGRVTTLRFTRGNIVDLDISHNPYLEEFSYDLIDGEPDKLKSLDLSKNKNIEELHYHGANLESLGVSHNPKLKILSCTNTKITKLDVSQNPNLEKLYCGECNLTNLYISKNNKLEKLNCSYNKLTKLNVSHNLNLKELYLEGNKLTKLDISKNTKLKRCEYAENPLTCIKINDLQIARFKDDIFKVDCE